MSSPSLIPLTSADGRLPRGLQPSGTRTRAFLPPSPGSVRVPYFF